MSDLKKEIERIERKAKSFHDYLVRVMESNERLHVFNEAARDRKQIQPTKEKAGLLKDIYVVYMATFGKYLPEGK